MYILTMFRQSYVIAVVRMYFDVDMYLFKLSFNSVKEPDVKGNKTISFVIAEIHTAIYTIDLDLVYTLEKQKNQKFKTFLFNIYT